MMSSQCMKRKFDWCKKSLKLGTKYTEISDTGQGRCGLSITCGKVLGSLS